MKDSTEQDAIIANLVDRYVRHVTLNINTHIKDERYKFDALRHFQNTFDIDANDLATNLKNALGKVSNLAVGAGYYPVASICEVAAHAPEETRDALRKLFSNDKPLEDRLVGFQQMMSPLSQQYSAKTVSDPYNMDLRFMSLLLSLRYPDEYLYFKPTQVDAMHTIVFGEKTGTRAKDPARVTKARRLGILLFEELQKRPEFQAISEAMGYSTEKNLWFAQDLIWYETTRSDDTLFSLKEKIKQYINEHPDYAQNLWAAESDINHYITEFKQKFAPEILHAMSDNDILRYVPFNTASNNDTLSYYLEFHAVLREYGGIGGGSAGKMGYYQGNDGQWKDKSDKPTTRDEVLRRRKRDIELLVAGYTFLENDDYRGLRQFQATLTDKKDALFYGQVWVRKYYAILFPYKYLQLYGKAFVKKLEAASGIRDIDGGEDDDGANWYEKTHRIVTALRELGLSNYALSNIIWQIINEESDSQPTNNPEKEPTMNQDLPPKNMIIYGPPGTGKTYSISAYKRTLLGDQSATEKTTLLDGLSSWHDAILKAFIDANLQPLGIKDILASPAVIAFAGTRNSKAPYGTIYTQILNRSTPESSTTNYRSGQASYNKVGAGEWELTEEGRAEAAELESFIKQVARPAKEIDSFYKFVTFHQSYGYEEFIEGIRASTDNGQIQYEVRDGVFKAFCERAKNDPDNNYLFVIDEINRGNISKIFGELITLIESNKRLGAEEELTVTLPLSGDTFGVPDNIYIIGTMNTADRSIALLDIALRRRFDFKEILPDPTLLPDDIEGVDLQQLLTAVNKKIEQKIDRNHQIGHSYLMKIQSLSDLHTAWYQRIIPLLQEYFYDDNDDLRSILKAFVDKGGVRNLYGDEFKQALMGLYAETYDTDTGIQL